MKKINITILMLWGNHGPAGIEKQWMLILNNLDKSVNKKYELTLFILHKYKLTNKEQISKYFSNNINIKLFYLKRIRFDIIKIFKEIYLLNPQLIVSSYFHLSLITFLFNIFYYNKIKVFHINQGLNPNKIILIPFYYLIYQSGYQTIVTSNGLRQYFINKVKVSERKIKTIYNPFDYAEIERLGNEHIDFNFKKNTMIYVGRIDQEQKNILMLLEAIKILSTKIKEFSLLIIGDGPDRIKCQNYVRDNKLDTNIFFIGWVDNVYPYIKKSDLLLLPSYYEGFGRVLVEALYLGTKVVSTNCLSGPSEILKDGKFGMLCPVNNPNMFADSIHYALNNKCSSQKDILKNLDRFDYREITRQYQRELFN